MKNKNYLFTIALTTLLLGACASAPIEHHTIRPLADGHTVPTSSREQPIIALRNLNLPGYMDEQEIVYLKGSSQIVTAQGHRWAEPLSENLRDVIVEQLQLITANPRVLAYPLANNIRPERIIDIQINDFAANQSDNTLLLRANWQITTPKQGAKPPPGYQLNRRYPLANNEIATLMRTYQQAMADLVTAINKSL